MDEIIRICIMFYSLARKYTDKAIKAISGLTGDLSASVEMLPSSSDPYARFEQGDEKTTLRIGIPKSDVDGVTFLIDTTTRQLIMRKPTA